MLKYIPTKCLFQWVRIQALHLVHGSTGPKEFTRHSASRPVHPRLQGSPVYATNTDHEPSNVCSNRPHLALLSVTAGDAA